MLFLKGWWIPWREQGAELPRKGRIGENHFLLVCAALWNRIQSSQLFVLIAHHKSHMKASLSGYMNCWNGLTAEDIPQKGSEVLQVMLQEMTTPAMDK